jgi:osmotically-inducible protein OsmY
LPVTWEQISVRNGWVKLEGEVEWQFQRQTAE